MIDLPYKFNFSVIGGSETLFLVFLYYRGVSIGRLGDVSMSGSLSASRIFERITDTGFTLRFKRGISVSVEVYDLQ